MTAPVIRSDRFDAAALAALLAERQAMVAAPPEAAERGIPLLVWRLDDARFGTPLDQLRSVAPLPRITPVPGAPPGLTGLVAWRGSVVNLLDPAVALDRPAPSAPAAMLLLRGDEPRIALRVSALEAVVEVAADPADLSERRLVTDPSGDRLWLADAGYLRKRLLAPRFHQEG